MKKFEAMTGGFEKMVPRHGFKKDKAKSKGTIARNREKENIEEYEEYYMSRYGEKRVQ